MASPASQPSSASQPEPVLVDQTALPQLPSGLEGAIRAHLGALLTLHGGKGHVLLRLDVKPEVRARWEISCSGSGEEPRG